MHFLNKNRINMKKIFTRRADHSGGMKRREFISACGACTACMAAMPFNNLSDFMVRKGAKKTKIRIVFSMHTEIQAQPDWPNVGFDFGPIMNSVKDELSRALPGFEFLTSMAKSPKEAQNILKADADGSVDGYLVYQLNCWNRVVQTLVKSEKPILYADFQYGGSGGFLVYNAGFIRDQFSNLGFVASSDMKDLISAVRCFDIVKKGGSAADFVAATEDVRKKNTPFPGNLLCKPDPVILIPTSACVQQLQNSKILAVRNTESAILEPLMNIPVEQIPFAEVNKAYTNADREEAKEVADMWISQAAEVIDVPYQTIEDSAAMYLGMKSVLKEHDANAITVNCLGGFYGGHIHAYPCLGFHQLNNEGLIGACECDLESTATMVAFTTLTGGRPGYISDPVIDTSKRQIIYAHCVASNKVFGPQGSSNLFTIMNHSEDRQGASVRSILPAGYMTTTMKANNERKEIIFHQAKTVENDPDDRACRTKLCAEPLGDIEKLFRYWDQWGWHRVTFYGDLKEPAYELADALGYKIVEEA
jgi:hypothetical protein